jgi:hypothetical protein
MAKGPKNEVDALLDSLVKGKKPEEILGQEGLLGELTKRLVERALEAELTAHVGYEKHAPEGRNRRNSRNGRAAKRVNRIRGRSRSMSRGIGMAPSSPSSFRSIAGAWRDSTTKSSPSKREVCPPGRSRVTCGSSMA